MQSILLHLRFLPETAALFLALAIFFILPLDMASNLGGFIGRKIGPGLKSSGTARRNLKMVFPEKSTVEIENIVVGMWDNLGRVMAEYAHLWHIAPRIELHGGEHFTNVLASGKAGLFCAAHIANWEVATVMAKQAGIKMHPVYRKPNNPAADWILTKARAAGAVAMIAKGRNGAKQMLAVMRRGDSLGIMLDQKLNEGIAVPFFGRDAMTADAIAVFALRFDCPIYPARVERINGAHFKMTIYPALKIEKTGDHDKDVRAILVTLHGMMEDWIRARPEQWLWSHRRWPDG